MRLFSPGGVGIGEGRGRWDSRRDELIARDSIRAIASWMDPAMLYWGQSGWAWEEGEPDWGPYPGLSRQPHPWLWKSLPGWPGIQTQTKGGFLSRLFVLLPQSTALCMAKANLPLQLGNPLWGLRGLPPRCCLSSCPGFCPATSSLWGCGCPAWRLTGQPKAGAEARRGASMAGRRRSETRGECWGPGARRLTSSWDEVFGGRVGRRFGSWGGVRTGELWSRGCGQSWSQHESPPGRGLSGLAPSFCPHPLTTGALSENLRPASGPAPGALFPPDLASLQG